jgi:hypothetical protein
MLARWRLAALILVGALAAPAAHAQTLTASQILSEFNAVIFGNFASSADVEGRVMVGGSVGTGATFYIHPGSE